MTNRQFHGFALIDNSNCSFCKTEVETLIHLLCICPVVNCFWEDVSSWLSVFLGKNITLINFNKLFGFPNFEDFTILLNCLLTTKKQCLLFTLAT